MEVSNDSYRAGGVYNASVSLAVPDIVSLVMTVESVDLLQLQVVCLCLFLGLIATSCRSLLGAINAVSFLRLSVCNSVTHLLVLANLEDVKWVGVQLIVQLPVKLLALMCELSICVDVLRVNLSIIVFSHVVLTDCKWLPRVVFWQELQHYLPGFRFVEDVAKEVIASDELLVCLLIFGNHYVIVILALVEAFLHHLINSIFIILEQVKKLLVSAQLLVGSSRSQMVEPKNKDDIHQGSEENREVISENAHLLVPVEDAEDDRQFLFEGAAPGTQSNEHKDLVGLSVSKLLLVLITSSAVVVDVEGADDGTPDLIAIIIIVIVLFLDWCLLLRQRSELVQTLLVLLVIGSQILHLPEQFVELRVADDSLLDVVGLVAHTGAEERTQVKKRGWKYLHEILDVFKCETVELLLVVLVDPVAETIVAYCKVNKN